MQYYLIVMQVEHYPNFTFLFLVSDKSSQTVLLVEIKTNLTSTTLIKSCITLRLVNTLGEKKPFKLKATNNTNDNPLFQVPRYTYRSKELLPQLLYEFFKNLT